MTPLWRIEMFGGLRAVNVTRPEQTVTRFRTQKTAALLAYFALKPGPQPREILCGLLWPDAAPDAARNSLSACLSSLRRQLESESENGLILADRFNAGLHPQLFATDVQEFADAQKRAEATHDDEARSQALAQAVEIYRGPFLPGFYDEWALAEARCREEEFIAAVSDLLDLLEDGKAWERAATLARHSLALHPDIEAWHLSAMRAQSALGRPELALRQFEELKQVLERDGNSPSPRSHKLHEHAQNQLNNAPQVLAEVLPAIEVASDAQVLAEPDSTPQVLAAPNSTPQVLATRLPTPLTRFFGRQDEIALIHSLLRENSERLVTLSGPGGSGKTRLAVEAARPLSSEWRDIVAFAPLADLSDAAFIFAAIRDALQLPAAPNIAPLDQILEALSNTRALLILDNFEQLVEEGAPLVQDLLEQLPELALLVTSRQVLGLPGEREFPVAPLPVPALDAAPELLKECSGTALFIDRAQLARVDFRVDERNAQAIAAVCQRLDGIPLALELAAARALVLSPTQMLSKLKTSFDLLATRQRGVPERHRTLRAAIAWSYGLLSEDLQRFFARLSVFRGGWTLEATETVCEEAEALDYLSRLRECSLIVTTERGGETRFRMLETLREYALDQLDEDERSAGENRYCAYFVALAETAEPHLRGPEQTFYLEQLEGEQDNFRAVLGWALENNADAALRLSAALASFWETRGHYAEGRGWIEQALAQTQNANDNSTASTCSEQERHRARALGGAGRFAWFGGDMVAASAHLEAGLTLLRERNDAEGALDTLSSLILVLSWQGEEARAIALVREGMALRERITDRAAALPTLSAFGWAIAFVVSPRVVSEGRAVNQEVLELARVAGDQRSEGVALACLGSCADWEGDFAAAGASYRASLPLLEVVEDWWMVGFAEWGLGRVELQLSHLDSALQHTQQTVRFQRSHQSTVALPFALESFAMIAFVQGRLERAARIFGAAQSIRDTLHTVAMPLMIARNQPYLQALRETLGADDFAAQWQIGDAMSMEAICAYALEENEESAPQVLADEAQHNTARALCSAGRLAWFEGDFSTAQARLEAGLELFKAEDIIIGAVGAMSSLIMVLTWQGKEERALALVRESRQMLASISDRASLLPVLSSLGYAVHSLSAARSQQDAREINQEVVALARVTEDKRSWCVAQACLGQCFYWAGDFARARTAYEASIEPLHEVGDAFMKAHSLWGLGRVAIAQGNWQEAWQLSQSALELRQGHSSLIGLPYMLENFALLALHQQPQNQLERAVRIFAAAARLRKEQNCCAQSLVVAENAKALAALRTALGEDKFERAWQAGHAMNGDEACAYALETTPQVPATAPDALWPANEEAAPISRARALCSAGRLAWFEGDFATARTRLEAALGLSRTNDDAAGALSALSSLILVLAWQGEEDQAIALVREGVALVDRVRKDADLLPLLSAFGWATFFAAAPSVLDDSRAVNEEVARLAHAKGDKRSLGVALACLGGYFYWRGEWESAGARYQECLPLLQEVGDYLMIPHALWGLGRVRVRQGHIAEARALIGESLRSQIAAHNSPIGIPYTIEGCAQIAAIAQPARAVTLFAAAAKLRETQNAQPQLLVVNEVRKYLQEARTKLGDAEFDAAWRRGCAMSREAACEFALRGLDE